MRKAGGGPRKRAQAEVRRVEALRLYTEAHLTFEQIGQRLGVSKPWAFRLVQQALEDLAQDRRDLAEHARDRDLSLIDFEIRQMMEIAVRPCDVCEGRAATNVEACPTCGGLGWIGKDRCVECGGRRVVGDPCLVCGRSGCFYSPDERMRAIDRIQRSSERRAKLLGLFAPTQIDLPHDRSFYADLEKIPDEELHKELRAFMVGVSTGRGAEIP